jgi:hypothetical protein
VFIHLLFHDGSDAGAGRDKIRYQHGKPHFNETGARHFSPENVIRMVDEDQDDPDKKSIPGCPPGYARLTGTSQPELHNTLIFSCMIVYILR